MAISSVAVYCGSRAGNDPAYLDAAARLGTLLAEAGITLIYGGSKVGLMGALADAALAAHGKVIGVIPEFLIQREVGHPGVTRLEIVASMHARKLRLFELAEAIVVLPGGLGTLDETLEVMGWRGLGTHAKRMLLVDTGGYWQPLLRLMDRVAEAGFGPPGLVELLEAVPTPEAALSRLTG